MAAQEVNMESDSIQDQFSDLTVQENGHKLATNLLEQCEIILSEIEIFHSFLVENKADDKVEIRHFRNDVRTEYKAIKKVC
jgi:hypothetical protein